jgi:hypothetical protein
MKTNRLFLVVFLAVAPLLGLRAAEQSAVVERVQVLFFEPKNFTDIGDGPMPSDSSRESDLTQIRDYLVRQGRYYVVEGQRLDISFTDIDRAGEFEPWRGSRWDEVRIVKDIYPPRMVLNFRLVDAEGNVIKQGKRELLDMAFMLKISLVDRNDPLHYDKALLDDWLRTEFPRVKKS